MIGQVPHWKIVVGFCIAAVIGYAGFSVWVIFSGDMAMKGDVIGTWKSFAVGAFAFWVGSSSAGKAKPEEPTKVEVMNPPTSPVQTTDAAHPLELKHDDALPTTAGLNKEIQP